MLPHGRDEDISSFASFEAARDALEHAVPYSTTVDGLKALGFDINGSGNVMQIPYPELISRLAPHPGVRLEDMDPGIRDCIAAREACRVYVFSMEHIVRRRNGNFLPDFLNFRRHTAITGWRFEGLVAVRNGVVLFRNYAGEPRIDRSERQDNPLGPLQPAGEGAGRLLVR